MRPVQTTSHVQQRARNICSKIEIVLYIGTNPLSVLGLAIELYYAHNATEFLMYTYLQNLQTPIIPSNVQIMPLHGRILGRPVLRSLYRPDQAMSSSMCLVAQGMCSALIYSQTLRFES